MATKRKKPNLIIGVRVEADLREWLKERADEFGLNMSQVIRDLLVKARARGWRFGDLPGATPDAGPEGWWGVRLHRRLDGARGRRP